MIIKGLLLGVQKILVLVTIFSLEFAAFCTDAIAAEAI
jgi:hypothetical protein